MKKCCKCRIVKTEDCFHDAKKAKDGKQSWCKECFSLRAKPARKKINITRNLLKYGKDVVDCMEEFDKNYIDHEAIREFEELGIL